MVTDTDAFEVADTSHTFAMLRHSHWQNHTGREDSNEDDAEELHPRERPRTQTHDGMMGFLARKGERVVNVESGGRVEGGALMRRFGLWRYDGPNNPANSTGLTALH